MSDLVLRHKGEEAFEEQEPKKPSLESFLKEENAQNTENEKLDENIKALDEANKEALQEQNEPSPPRVLNLPSNVSTGSKILDEKIKKKELSLYDIYALKKMGLNSTALNEAMKDKSVIVGGENGENSLSLKGEFGARVKRLNGDKDYEQLKELNNAFENLNSIVANSNETSGIQNHLARKWSNMTNHFIFSADEGNQQRIFDESNLYGNYLNAIKLRSGGTQKERARMTEALNFGGLNAEATRQKALSIYENFFQRQNNALKVLKSKGYDEGTIFEALGEEGRNNFINNRKAYEYLKSNEFDKDEFEKVYKYGEFFKGGKK
ncbi:hypothetical protein [Campylobacter vulpis]|uniref:hypothetical protein n=1 Tax=Campylobacter vulpis TaxID=1655500 RepID=UPI000C1612AC|nr:hypothetical protein [Campylobacter vulpis]MBS4276048.1 hypothetical protein [Campylobacter vulpis]MBS4307423.1 hypothetical protein [Campylobacter vulpis]MBS4330364.1 hypothetical protein [Campylobacter vulpis]MBS4423934.1 hypothetical protein [Campylobacter vulpis]PHY89940.1 hypothetical protein AA995_07325 [Campylobacter vulpis]